jgi:hypothetical protein
LSRFFGVRGRSVTAAEFVIDAGDANQAEWLDQKL